MQNAHDLMSSTVTILPFDGEPCKLKLFIEVQGSSHSSRNVWRSKGTHVAGVPIRETHGIMWIGGKTRLLKRKLVDLTSDEQTGKNSRKNNRRYDDRDGDTTNARKDEDLVKWQDSETWGNFKSCKRRTRRCLPVQGALVRGVVPIVKEET